MDEKMKSLIDKIVPIINNNENTRQNYKDIIYTSKKIATLSVLSETINSIDTTKPKKSNMYMVNTMISILNKNKISPGTAIEILYIIQTYIIEKYPELNEIADYLIKNIEVK